MRYPPALIYTPGRSRVYLVVACGVTMILIALCAHSVPATGQFGLKNVALMLLSACAAIWLLRDAWAQPRGQLHYAQGQWLYAQESQETVGTLQLHLDLQSYMLVSFLPQQPSGRFFLKTTQWFHLEATQIDPAAGKAAWLALRRAVLAASEHSLEEHAA
jgi:hypothetical protein